MKKAGQRKLIELLRDIKRLGAVSAKASLDGVGSVECIFQPELPTQSRHESKDKDDEELAYASS